MPGGGSLGEVREQLILGRTEIQEMMTRLIGAVALQSEKLALKV